MNEHLHPDIALVLPGFAGTIHGRDALVAGFEDFCKNAKILEYEESDENIEVVGSGARNIFPLKLSRSLPRKIEHLSQHPS